MRPLSRDARLAQSVERQPFKLVVVGSSPTVGEIFGAQLSLVTARLARRADERQCVRVVKESDSKSDGLCPRGFESPRCRVLSHQPLSCGSGMISQKVKQPNIAQLVERSTVDAADIEWSLVRFRVFGFSLNQNVALNRTPRREPLRTASLV